MLYARCALFGIAGWLIADWVGWDLILLLESGSTSPDWALRSMNADAEHMVDGLIHSVGSLFGFAFGAITGAQKRIEESEGLEQHLIES